ncbi:MAG: hypothetical protein WA802_05490 [Terracidiphilus sp.]
MGNKLSRFRNVMLGLGVATVTLFCVPRPTHAQSSTTQAQPSTTQTQTSTPQDRQAATSEDNRRENDRGDVANFDRFLDEHREITEQVRKDPSLLDNRDFVRDHPALQTYFQDNPGVRDQIRQNPTSFMRQEDAFDRDSNMRDRDRDAGAVRDNDRRNVANGADRSNDRRDVASFDRFLDSHREIAEQVRKDPSLLDNRDFVQTHPALRSYLQDSPGVRDQIRQNPNAFMHEEDAYDHDANYRDRDPRHERMADFGGFLQSHRDIEKDLSRDPSKVNDHDYVHQHGDLDAYLNTHPDVRNDLMSNPQDFVHGIQQYQQANPTGMTGVSGRGTGAAGSATGTTQSMTGTSMTQKPTKPNQ